MLQTAMPSVEIIASISNEAPSATLRKRANIRTNNVVGTKRGI